MILDHRPVVDEDLTDEELADYVDVGEGLPAGSIMGVGS